MAAMGDSGPSEEREMGWTLFLQIFGISTAFFRLFQKSDKISQISSTPRAFGY